MSNRTKRTAPRGGRGALLGGAAVAVAGLLASLALVYTNATGVSEVAADARLQQESESALGAAAAARNSIAQALILASSPDTDPDLVSAWIEEAALVVDALAARVEALLPRTASPAALQSQLDQVVLASKHVLTALDDDDVDTAGSLATNELAGAFDQLTESLVEVRDGTAQAIAAADLEAGSVATAARFMVAFLVPTIAVIAAFVISRRARRRERLATELEKERTINRSKDQLIANLSHELRTPLTGIYTSALAMEEVEFGDPELLRELNGMIIDQSADLTRMVEDLLVSAQAEAGRLNFAIESVPVKAEVDAIVTEFTHLGNHVTATIEETTVLADPGRLRQLLRNLVSNASRHGGPRIMIAGRRTGTGYVIEVIDDGAGIPADLEERLFQRFIHEGDRPLIVGSVGLGLAICRVLAEGMDGTIEYRRRNGATVFSVTLPMPLGVPARESVSA